MKKRLQWFSSGIPFLFLTACGSMVTVPVQPADVAVKEIRTAVASVSQSTAVMEDGNLVVSGRLRRMHDVKIPGHVDVTLCGPQGMLARKSVSVPGLSSNRRGSMHLPFKTRFDQTPPPGSEVLIRYHAPPFTDEGIPGCG